LNILIFDRPFTSAFTRLYRTVHGSGHSIRFVSDFKFRDDVGLVRLQYKHLRRSDVDLDRGLDYEVVARRCRYLRHQQPDLQKRLINSAWLAIDEIFQRCSPDAFVGLPMDNYYLDLVDQWCARNGTFAINPVQSLLPQRTRVCRRGEYQRCRNVDTDEVARYRAILCEPRFRPTWLSAQRSRAWLLRMYAREIAKRAFFRVAKTIKADPYSFHYNCVYPIGAAVRPLPADLLTVKSLFVRSLDEVGRARERHRAAVFLPLQFTPESSLDYNIPDSRFTQYGALLDAVLSGLPSDVLLIVKEHPDMYGYRSAAFFERFARRSNVVIADVDITVQQIFDLCEYVLVTGSASTGVEALVKRKTVISLGGAFYGGGNTIHEILDFDGISNWAASLSPIHNTEERIDSSVRKILSNTIVGTYDFVRVRGARQWKARRTARAIMDYVIANA